MWLKQVVRNFYTLALDRHACQGYNQYIVSSDTHPCPENSTNCHNLTFYTSNLSQYFTSDTTFVFLSGSHTLNSPLPVVINNITNITLTGGDYTTAVTAAPTIRCNKKSFGLIFENTLHITFSRLVVSGCGRTIRDSGLVMKNATTVTLKHFTVQQTLGIGVTMENVSNVTVLDSTFSDNGIGVKNCSTLQTYQAINITASNIDQVSYTIVNTTFDGNSFTKQLGGGLYIYITNTTAANVTVDGCQFMRIRGCLSAGANIIINGYQQQGIVLVVNSLFSDNIRIHEYTKKHENNIKLYEGALKIEAIQHVTSYSQLEQALLLINVSHSVFMRNKGSYCGGVGIVVHSGSSQAVIAVKHSKIVNNTGTWLGGGMCIAPISEYISNQHLTINVSNCLFDHNNADCAAALMIWSFWYSNTTFKISIDSCSFRSNFNTWHYFKGGNGIFMIYWSYSNTRLATQAKMIFLVKLYNCFFVKNLFGPTLYLSYTGQQPPKNVYTLDATVYKCIFDNNKVGYVPSGIQIYTANNKVFITIYMSIFSNSFGSAMLITNQNAIWTPNCTFSVNITNVNVTSITMPVGDSYLPVIYINSEYYSSTTVNVADVRFCNNQATALSIENTALMFSGYNVIFNNTAPALYNGGGLVIRGTGYTINAPNTTLIFQNNKANFGGAIYSFVKEGISRCTFNDFDAIFLNNFANTAGNNIYGGIFTQCVEGNYQEGDIYFITERKNICKIIPNNFKETISGIGVSSDPYNTHSCNENITTNNTSVDVSIYPGHTFYLTLSTTGFCNNFSPGFINISTSKGLRIEADVQSQHIDVPCKKVSFIPSLLSHSISEGDMTISIGHPTFVSNRQLKVNILLLPCPHGMYVGPTGICQCDKEIANLLQCNISWMPDPFIKLGTNNWLSYDNQENCTAIANVCPFDYCSVGSSVLFNLDNNTHYQCSNNRTGTLCGHCQPGLSLMLGSNACSQCSNSYLLLLLAFIIAGIVLVVFIIGLNMTVSVGRINGLLFYANIVKLNESMLFPDGSIPVVSQFISWINLDLGIEVCLFNGLDGYWKIWLQYVFPLYLWLLTAVIIICSKHSIKFSNWLRSNIISVLATLVLLSFTKLLRNITAAFMATRLECGKHSTLVWSIDGTVKYFSVKHSILVVISALALFFVAPYTIVILFSQCLQRAKCNGISQMFFQLHPFIDAYAGPYTVKHRYWTGVLLVIRIFITLTFSYTSGSITYINNNVIILIECTIIWNIFHSDMYRSQFTYLCEKFFHFNLCALCLLNSSLAQSSYKQYTFIATTISVAASLIMFVVIVLQQVYEQYLAGKLTNSKTTERQPLLNKSNDSDCYSPARVVNRRDSIIFHYD